MGGQLPNLEWMPHQASNKKRWAANHWFPRSSNYVRDDEWPKNLVGGQSQVSILRGATGSRIRMKYGWQPSPSNSGEVDRNWKNLGREDGIGTKMPPAETKIKQTMLHPRSKTHYKIKCLVVQVMLNKDHPFKDKIEKSWVQGLTRDLHVKMGL